MFSKNPEIIKRRLRERMALAVPLSQNGYGNITFHAVCAVKQTQTAWKIEHICLEKQNFKNNVF